MRTDGLSAASAAHASSPGSALAPSVRLSVASAATEMSQAATMISPGSKTTLRNNLATAAPKGNNFACWQVIIEVATNQLTNRQLANDDQRTTTVNTVNISTFPRPTTDAQCQQLWEDLQQTAAAASAEYLSLDSTSLYRGGLGSAWIDIPNRGKLAKWLVANGLGRLQSGGGVALHAYPRFGFPETGQSEGHSLFIKRRLRDRLADYGVQAKIGSYSS